MGKEVLLNLKVELFAEFWTDFQTYLFVKNVTHVAMIQGAFSVRRLAQMMCFYSGNILETHNLALTTTILIY